MWDLRLRLKYLFLYCDAHKTGFHTLLLNINLGEWMIFTFVVQLLSNVNSTFENIYICCYFVRKTLTERAALKKLFVSPVTTLEDPYNMYFPMGLSNE